MVLKKDFYVIPYDFDQQTSFKVTTHPLTMGTLSEVYTRLDQGQRRYAPDKRFWMDGRTDTDGWRKGWIDEQTDYYWASSEQGSNI